MEGPNSTGGNIGLGALTGAISGLIFFGAGQFAVPAVSGALGAKTGLEIAAVTTLVHAAAGAVSGGINSAITGSDIGLGMLTGAVGAGIGAATGGALTHFKLEQFGYQLVARTVAGGIAGGIVSEIYGGNFWQGFEQGAATAAAAFLFNCAMSKRRLLNQSPTRQVWFDTETGKIVPAIGEYPNPLTELMRDALTTGAKAVDTFFDNPASNEATKGAPVPITDLTTIIYNAYALAQGYYKAFFQPYVRSLIKK